MLAGGEIYGAGSAIKLTGRAGAVFGYGIALAGGADVCNELNDAIVSLVPFGSHFADSIKNGLNSAENAAGVGHTGCQRTQ